MDDGPHDHRGIGRPDWQERGARYSAGIGERPPDYYREQR